MEKVLTHFIIMAIAIGIASFLARTSQSKNKQRYKKPNTWETPQENTNPEPAATYWNSYQPKYLMTINEKTQYRKLKSWADTKGWIIFAKVRVLDIIEPRKDPKNYKSLFWKVQAKHVDFLLCDQDIRIRYIIELDDNSHNQKERQERDEFLKQALEGAGYKVIHTRAITEELLNTL